MEEIDLSAFQITPFGFIIIGIYSFGIWVIALVFSRIFASFRKRWWILGPPTLAMIALPWGEEIWIASRFKEACSDAGVKVYRQVEVDGFYDSTMRSGYSLIREKGFAFMEHPSNKKGKVDHIEIEHGEWVTKTIDQPSARYHFKHFYQPKPFQNWVSIGWRIDKIQYEVIDTETDEVLGVDVRIKRYPSFAESLWLRFFDPRGVGCSGPLDTSKKHSRTGILYDHVIIPKKVFD